MTTTMFKPAVKHEAKLRLAIAGPSGSGKTYTSLAVGTALVNGGSIAVVDTEHGSASKYADAFSFDVLEMRPPFHPDRFVEAIRAAESAGYGVLILDSLSHAWSGEGGLLELVDQFAARMKTSNSFAAWKDATPIQNRLVEAIVGANIHIIAAMRSKQEYVLDTVQKNGRDITVPRKVGMAPVQRDSFEYEFDVYLDMDMENNAIVQKTRCPALTGRVFPKPGADLAGILAEWLGGIERPDPLIAMLEAESAEAWAIAAYELPYARNAFEAPQRVVDFRNYLTGGKYKAADNPQLAQILKTYCEQVADGVKVKTAAQRALELFSPLFGEDEEE